MVSNQLGISGKASLKSGLIPGDSVHITMLSLWPWPLFFFSSVLHRSLYVDFNWKKTCDIINNYETFILFFYVQGMSWPRVVPENLQNLFQPYISMQIGRTINK